MIGQIQAKAAEFIIANLGRIVIVLVVLAAFAFSHWFAYTAGKNAVKADNNATQIVALNGVISGLVRANERNLAQTKTLLEAERKKKQQVEYVTMEIPKYVTLEKDVDCAANPDIVRLLNKARMPTDDASSAGLSAYQGTAVGSVGYIELLTDHATISAKYETLRNKYNAWIDWYEDGLREQELNRKK